MAVVQRLVFTIFLPKGKNSNPTGTSKLFADFF